MKRLITIAFISLFCVICLSACGCKHEWAAATCQSPKTCLICGKVVGKIGDHEWTDATCAAPKTCKVCGVTDGDMLPHTPSDEWVVSKTSYTYAQKTYVQKCTVCGETVKQKHEDIDKLYDGTVFLISAEDFTKRMDYILSTFSDNTYSAKSGSYDGNYACGILDGSNKAGVVMFTKFDDKVSSSESTKECNFNKIIGITTSGTASARISVAMIMAADPTIDFDTAKEYAQELLRSGEKSVNGIDYVAISSGQEYFIGLTLEGLS